MYLFASSPLSLLPLRSALTSRDGQRDSIGSAQGRDGQLPAREQRIEYTPSREERKTVNQVKKAVMGNDASKLRLDAASKTGIYNITGKECREFPKDCLRVANLRLLTLDGCGLESVPMEISALAGSLQKLVLPSNKLRSLPPQLGALAALQQIDVSKNALEALPDCFAAMLKLKELSVAHNKLQALPASLCDAKSLTLLDVVRRLSACCVARAPPLRVCLSCASCLNGKPHLIKRLAGNAEQ